MENHWRQLYPKYFLIAALLVCISRLADARNDWDNREDVEAAIRLGVGAIVGIVIAVILVIIGCCVLICRICCGACQPNRTVVNYQTVVHRPPPHVTQMPPGPVILNVAPQPSPTGYHPHMVPPSHPGYANANVNPGASAPYAQAAPPPYNPDMVKMH